MALNFHYFSYNFYIFFYYFIVYSCLGWCIETIYAYVKNKKFVNRGFLFGPFCPMYGLGAVMLVATLGHLNINLFLLFILSTILTSTLEYFTAYLLEQCFHSTWWDYSNDLFNLKGRICLIFSILWGILSIVFIKFIHPLFVKANYFLNSKYATIILNLIFIYFIVDLTFTLISLSKLNSLFNQLKELNTEIKYKINHIKGTDIEKKETLENIAKELKSRYEYIFHKMQLNHSRLINAFPEFTSKKLDNFIENIKEKITSALKR